MSDKHQKIALKLLIKCNVSVIVRKACVMRVWCILIHKGSDIKHTRVKGQIWHMEAVAAHMHAIKTNEKTGCLRLTAHLSVVGGGRARGILVQERGLSAPLS